MGISSLFGLGMVQLGRKRNGKGLKQLGAGHCK
jgi:hypothetical protein